MTDEPEVGPHDNQFFALTNVQVLTWPQEASMDWELYHALVARFGEPVIVRVCGLTYEVKPEGAMLPQSIALPEHNHNQTTPDTVLVAK